TRGGEMPLGIETSDCSDRMKSPATTGVEPAGGAVVGGGWGQSLSDDGPSLYGPSRPDAEGCSPSAGTLVPGDVGGVTLSRDEVGAPTGRELLRNTTCRLPQRRPRSPGTWFPLATSPPQRGPSACSPFCGHCPGTARSAATTGSRCASSARAGAPWLPPSDPVLENVPAHHAGEPRHAPRSTARLRQVGWTHRPVRRKASALVTRRVRGAPRCSFVGLPGIQVPGRDIGAGREDALDPRRVGRQDGGRVRVPSDGSFPLRGVLRVPDQPPGATVHSDPNLLHLLDGRCLSGIGATLHDVDSLPLPTILRDDGRHPRGIELPLVVDETPGRRAVLPQQCDDAAMDGPGVVQARPGPVAVSAVPLLRRRLADVKIDLAGIGDHIQVVLVLLSHFGATDPCGVRDTDE